MQSDYESAVWAENFPEFSKTVGEFFTDIKLAMERLNAIQFEAPWRADAERQRCDG